MHVKLLLKYIVIALTCISLINSNTVAIPGFSIDGSLNYLSRAQAIVEEYDSTAFALKFKSAQVLVTLQKEVTDNGENQNDNQCSVFYKTDKLIAAFVGRKVECLHGRRLTVNIVDDYEHLMGTCISAQRLGCSLAQIAHEQGMFPMIQPLGYNVILMGSHNRNEFDTTSNANISNVYLSNLIRIDVSGNFYLCDATAAGKKALNIRHWFETKGRGMIFNLTSTNNNITSTNDNITSTDDDITSTNDDITSTNDNMNSTNDSMNSTNDNNEIDDILVVLGLAYNCIDEVFLDNENANNITVVNCTQSSQFNVQIAFNGIYHEQNNIIGPLTLSRQIFTNISKNESLQQKGLKIWTFLKQSKLV